MHTIKTKPGRLSRLVLRNRCSCGTGTHRFRCTAATAPCVKLRLLHGWGDIEPPRPHLVQRPAPRVIFLDTPRPAGIPADRVMPDLVQEDHAAHRPPRVGRLDEPADGPVVVPHHPRAATRARAPLAHPHAVGPLHLAADVVVAALHGPAARGLASGLILGQAQQVPERGGEPGHSGSILVPTAPSWPRR